MPINFKFVKTFIYLYNPISDPIFSNELTCHFHILKLSAGKFEVFNPELLLDIGRTSNLNETKLKSFELFRNTLKDVEIVTFDEHLERTMTVFGNFIEIKKRKGA